MKKEEFLEKLREKLSILEESEIDDIVNEYSEHISEKLKTKKKEEKIIEEFGDIDELASGILKAYKINDNYKEKNEFNETAKKYFNKFEKIINKIVKKFSSSSFGEILKFGIEIFIICILIALIKIPFNFVENVINKLFIGWISPLNSIFPTIFTFIIEVLYLLVAFLMFVTIFNERYLAEDEDLDIELKNRKNIDKNKIINESNTKKEINEKSKKKLTAFDSLSNFIFIITKILLAFVSLPLILTFIISISFLVLSILFSIEYYQIIGIIIALIGVLFGHIWLITILYNFIFNKANNGKYLFVIFIISLVLIGSGVGYAVIEFSSLDLQNINELNLPIKTDEYIYNLEDVLNDNNNDFDISLFDDENVNIITDNTMNNNVKINVSYIESLISINAYEGDYYSDFHIYYNIDVNKEIKLLLENLKDKKIYDFESADVKIDIYVSEENREKIKIND